MRRKAGIAFGACAALVLTGTAGVTAWAAGGDGRVGTWHEAPAISRTPVAAELSQPGATTATTGTSAAPPAAAGRAASPAITETRPGATKLKTTRHGAPESASAADGRQRVGELLNVDRLLGYLGKGPQRETFRYPGASYVKLHFRRMAMLPGDYLTVSNADGTESYRYDAPKVLETGSVDKWAMSVTGDTAVLEMHRTADVLGLGSLLGTLGVDVDHVARGFSRTEQARQPEGQLTAPGRTGREESVCGSDTSADAVCYRSADPVAYTKSKAIARLLINGTELCTGWRVGANNRMLTNNHCFTTSSEAYDTEVWFNYQCASCGGYDVFQPTKVWGSKVLSTDHVYDYTLFTVDNFPAVRKFGYLQLDTVRPAKGQELYVPQHPAGEPTRIAGSLGEKAGNCSVADPNYTGYAASSDVSYYCDTEGGSSGSPVLSRATNRVVALHHFGGCPNSGVRGDLLAARLRSLL
ncbi:trypsin-like serine peptidase [Paractinoplanes globisporus]|uniref:Trypsin-like serine peptidase n=1 Tax=Paractinoplanes globisporus TaxID=113565 RepID=A0ABW6WQG8_9ACTN|nr:serine protease [Actinoplanes globisporus]